MDGGSAGNRLAVIRPQAAERVPARARLPFVRPEALGMVFDFALSPDPQGNILCGAATDFCSLMHTFKLESRENGANRQRMNREKEGARRAGSKFPGCLHRNRPHDEKWLVDVAGIEPATPCLQIQNVTMTARDKRGPK